jgi:hypothetical protein
MTSEPPFHNSRIDHISASFYSKSIFETTPVGEFGKEAVKKNR